MNCKITLGIFIRNARKELGLSQKELAAMVEMDWVELTKIENEHTINIRHRSYDWLVETLSKIFNVDAEYLEQLRQQSELKPQSTEQGIFIRRFRL